ncbi:MAG: class I SAM-dependent methyltransferase [Chloroflexota bacterium]
MTNKQKDLAEAKKKAQASWQASDYAMFATCLEPGLADFMTRLTIVPGQKVLDIACGSGNFALLAAQREAIVTGIDFNPDALDAARGRATDANVNIQFDEGDIEQMPYEADTFDSAISVFGIMFAIDSQAAAREVSRVLKPGGTFAIASWTEDSLVGELARVLARYRPDSPGSARTSGWGDVGTVPEYFNGLTNRLQMSKRMWRFDFPYGPEGVVDFFCKYTSTHKLIFERLGSSDTDVLRYELEQVWLRHNQANGSRTVADAEYLEVVGVIK